MPLQQRQRALVQLGVGPGFQGLGFGVPGVGFWQGFPSLRSKCQDFSARNVVGKHPTKGVPLMWGILVTVVDR